jgi:O-methyltransferase
MGLLSSAKRAANWGLNSLGFHLVKDLTPPDIPEAHVVVAKRVSQYTMTSLERLSAAQSAVEYIVRNRIPGEFVECGVWRGGTVMAIILTLLRLGDTTRTIYLYDTFQGMTPPTTKDRDLFGVSASNLLRDSPPIPGNNVWAIAHIEDVRANVFSLGYPKEKIVLIQGDVKDTLPIKAPQGEIAILRLDTDWYESTKHELACLYPQVTNGGILIIDDYGHYSGARTAVDEYFSERGFMPFLNRIDYTGRLAIKNDAYELCGSRPQPNAI